MHLGFMTVFIVASALAQATPAQPVPGPADTGQPLIAGPGDAGAMRIHVGDTGIRCVKLPCPSRGLFLPDPQKGGVPRTFLFTDRDGQAPPPMIGRDADLAAIRSAWKDRACLALDGRLISGEEDRPVLRVDRVVGPCRDARR